MAILFMSPGICQTTIQGGIRKSYSIDDARAEAFLDLEKKVPLKGYARLDPDIATHFKARIEKQGCFTDHTLSFFSTGNYAVAYYGDYESFYYAPNGQTLWVEKQTKPIKPKSRRIESDYPRKAAVYQYPIGKLMLVRLAISPTEDYSFQPTGELFQYCKDDTCFDSNMKIVGHRSEENECSM